MYFLVLHLAHWGREKDRNRETERERQRERERAGCLTLSFCWCHVAVSILCYLLMVPFDRLQYVIVVFPCHTHLLFLRNIKWL